MSDKKNCVPGCSGVVGLHRFPDPNKERERFDHSINVIGGSILSLDHEFIHKYRRVCLTHFDEEYICRNNRISKSAIPTLMMPDSLLTDIGRPMRELQNLPEYFPSSSQGLLRMYTTDERPSKQFQYLAESLISTSQVPSDIESSKDTVPGSKSQFTQEEENYDTRLTIPSTRKCIRKRSVALTPAEQNLYKKLKTVQAKLYKCRNRVKKQSGAIKIKKKIMLNPNHLNVLGNMPSASRVLTLQCRENKKKDKGRRFQMDEKNLALSIFKQTPKAFVIPT